MEFVALDGDAVRRHRRRTGGRGCTGLGAEAQVEKEVGSLRFGLRNLATAAPGSRAAEGMAQVVATVAERLDALLLAPLHLDDRPLVLVPTGELHALPWSMLPSLAQRPVAVAPSLRLWHRAATEPQPSRPAAGVRRRPAAAGRDGGDRDAGAAPPRGD